MSATGLNKFEFLKPDNDYYLYHTTRGNLVKISPTGTGGFQFWDLTKESEEGEFAIIFRIGTFCAVWFEDWGISDSLLPNEFLFSIGNGWDLLFPHSRFLHLTTDPQVRKFLCWG